jgi:hypothetical protein
MYRSSRLLVCLLAGLLFAACAPFTSRASAGVPLAIPDPPPHSTIPPVEIAQKAQPETTPPPTTDSPADRGNRPAPAPSPAARPPAAGSQTAAPPPVAPSTAAPTQPAAATELRPAGAPGTQTLSAQQVREIMRRTQQKLNALDRRKLTAGKRDDFDAARQFLSQADTAVKANDLLLAQSSAEKAQALANGLR